MFRKEIDFIRRERKKHLLDLRKLFGILESKRSKGKKIFKISEWVEGSEDLWMDVMPAVCGGTWSIAHHHNHQLSWREVHGNVMECKYLQTTPLDWVIKES